MVMIKDNNGTERFSLDTRVMRIVERIKNKINKEDSMFLSVVWGGVGEGKSLFAQRIGFAIDPTLEITRVCFTKEEFINAVIENDKKVIIADEGISMFFSRASMTKEGRLMSELMAQIRQKNLCVIICVPEILSVDWLVLKASNMVAYVWESTQRGSTIKGNVAFYPSITGDDFKTKMIHFLKRKKSNPYAKLSRPSPWCTQKGNFIGGNNKKPWFPVGEIAYRNKKESILKKYDLGEKKEKKLMTAREKRKNIQKELLISIINKIVAKEPDISNQELGKRIEYTRQWVNSLRKSAVKGNSDNNV